MESVYQKVNVLDMQRKLANEARIVAMAGVAARISGAAHFATSTALTTIPHLTQFALARKP